MNTSDTLIWIVLLAMLTGAFLCWRVMSLVRGPKRRTRQRGDSSFCLGLFDSDGDSGGCDGGGD